MWDDFLKYINDSKDALTWIFGSGFGIALATGIYRLIVWLLQT